MLPDIHVRWSQAHTKKQSGRNQLKENIMETKLKSLLEKRKWKEFLLSLPKGMTVIPMEDANSIESLKAQAYKLNSTYAVKIFQISADLQACVVSVNVLMTGIYDYTDNEREIFKEILTNNDITPEYMILNYLPKMESISGKRRLWNIAQRRYFGDSE